MKTLVKVVLYAALIMLVLGVVVSCTACMMGASPWGVGNSLHDSRFVNIPGTNNWGNNQRNAITSNLASHDTTIDAAGLRNLDFGIGLGEASIQQGENFEIIFANEASRNHFYHYRVGDTWRIGSHEYRWRGWWRNNRDDLSITIIIPDDFVAERADIAVGMGVLRAENLSARNIELYIGMGSATIRNLSADRLIVGIGMGDLEINNCDASNIIVDVGMGSADIRLTRPVADYRGQASGGLGSANIGTHRFSGVFSSSFGASNAPYYIEINVGLGSVDIR
jgi:hypothetical protein